MTRDKCHCYINRLLLCKVIPMVILFVLIGIDRAIELTSKRAYIIEHKGGIKL